MEQLDTIEQINKRVLLEEKETTQSLAVQYENEKDDKLEEEEEDNIA